MKRLIALAASLTLFASMLTGCGSDDDSSDTKAASTKAASSQADDDTTEETEEDTSEKSGSFRVPQDDDAATEDPSEETSDAPAAEGTSFKHGVIGSDNVYSSEYAGFSFATPSKWTVMTEEQLMAMMNLGLEVTGNEDMLDEELMKQAAIFDYSARSDKGQNITFVFENLEISTGSKFASSITAKEYLEALIEQLGTVSGVEYSDISGLEEVSLGGQKFCRQSFSANYTMMGYTVKQYYYVKKYDGLMMYIIMTSSTDGEDMTVYEKNFKPFD